MANLQDQLGLDRIQAQTAIMNAQAYNKQNSSQPGRFQIEGGASVGSTGAIGSQALSNPGEYQSRNQGTIDEPQLLNPYNYVAPVTPTSTSTSNIGIGDTFSGITNSGITKKKNTNIAQSTKQIDTIPPIGGVPTVPVSPTLAINQQQRLANIAKRQGIMGQVALVAPIPSPTGLQGAELQAYNQLTPQEQKTFQALATQGIKAQTDYLQQSKANQEYLKSQEELNKQMEQNRDQAEDIQARQQLESTAKQVANLKQNIGYLGSQGQPGVSATKLDAVSNQVALAQKTYDDVVKIDQLNKANRQLGQESHAIQFTRQMTQLQDDLDSKVNKTIQGALNQFNAAELKGKLDTIPEIEAFQQQLYAQLDGDLSSIMDTNIEARKFLIDRYDRLAESQKEQMQATAKAESEYQKNANTLNKEMSNALGYFVNENGDPLVDQKTGQQIVVPPETTTNYDASTGQMILMTKNRDGTVGIQVKQVGSPKATYQKVGTDPNTGEDIYGFVNPQAQTITPYVSPTGEATGDLRYLANQYPGQAWAKNNNPAGITWNSNFDKGLGTARLLQQAGIQYSKGTARPSNEGGNYVTFNTIEDGLRAQQIMMTQTYGNSTVGQMLSSWVGTSEGPNYAKQVASMAGVSTNTKVSDLSPEQLSTLQMAKIQKESPGLYKLLTQPTTTPTNANQYTDQNVNDLAYLTELQEKNPTQAAKDMKELGYTARDLANYKAGNVPLTEKQKTTSTDIISSITDLVTNYDWNDAVGKFDYTRLIGTQDAEDTNVAINNLVAKLTLPNLGVLKGPMSDKDIQFIKEASSKLSTTQSNSSFERNLIDAYNLAARRAGKPEIKKLSDISAGTQSSTVGGELDYSKYE